MSHSYLPSPYYERLLVDIRHYFEDPVEKLRSHTLGKKILQTAHFPVPTPLQRFSTAPYPSPYPLIVAGKGGFVTHCSSLFPEIRWEHINPQPHFDQLAQDPRTKISGCVIDTTGFSDYEDLDYLRISLQRALPRCQPHSRCIILGRNPTNVAPSLLPLCRGVEGFVRSLAKELTQGMTANLIHVQAAEDSSRAEVLSTTFRYLLSAKSAFITGQVFPLQSSEILRDTTQSTTSYAVVTGAARGIGAEISRILARENHTVIAVDIPAAMPHLHKLCSEIDAIPCCEDITDPQAGRKILDVVPTQKISVFVNNAGITKDTLFHHMPQARWDAVLSVNLRAPERICWWLLENEGLVSGASVINVSSIAGIAGNKGQTNYAYSKAGLIGLTQALTLQSTHLLRANTVCPGFIETPMTAKIPLTYREMGRRLSSLGQGGLPVDVAEHVAYLADPSSTCVYNTHIRVCGQNIMGA